jgi:hypothetical protein
LLISQIAPTQCCLRNSLPLLTHNCKWPGQMQTVKLRDKISIGTKDYGDKSAVYFPIAWRSEWGGSTYFKIGDAQREVKYKQNRLVLFDANISHAGSGPSMDNVAPNEGHFSWVLRHQTRQISCKLVAQSGCHTAH